MSAVIGSSPAGLHGPPRASQGLQRPLYGARAGTKARAQGQLALTFAAAVSFLAGPEPPDSPDALRRCPVSVPINHATPVSLTLMLPLIITT